MAMTRDTLERMAKGLASYGGANEIDGLLDGYGLLAPGKRYYVSDVNITLSDGSVVTPNDGHDGLSWREPLATIARAHTLATASQGDAIICGPGFYNETVTVTKSGLFFIGAGARGAVGIEATAAGAEGMQIAAGADDVTLVNFGVAGDDTSDYALNLNSCARFRAYGCKIEKGDGAGDVVRINGTATDQVADALFYDCEICWGSTGVSFDDSLFGFPTQIFFQKCRFHNLSVAHFAEAAGGAVVNLQVHDCVHDRNEAGVIPTDWINMSSAASFGIFANNRFAAPDTDGAGTAGVFTIPAGILWVANYGENGPSTSRPAA